MNVIDQYSDEGFHMLADIIRDYPLSVDGLIKEAMVDVAENNKVASSAFAWDDMRLFRIDTPGNAALSNLYITKQASIIPAYVVNKCARALDIYGVKLPAPRAAEPITQNTKVAADEYVLPNIRRFRVRNTEDVKLAEERLLANAALLDPETMVLGATRLAQFAANMDVPIKTATLQYAGVTMCDPTTLHGSIVTRRNLTQNDTVKVAFDTIANELAVVEYAMDDRADLVKIAEAIRELDALAGLETYYGAKIADPVLTVFNTGKVAADTIVLAGVPVPVETLLSIPRETYVNVLGADLTDDFFDSAGNIIPEQLKVIMPTVPNDLLVVLLAQLGIA